MMNRLAGLSAVVLLAQLALSHSSIAPVALPTPRSKQAVLARPRPAPGPESLLRLKGGDGPPCGRKLTIALASWESLHSIAVGGVAPHVTELAAALCRRGHEVHVYTRAAGARGSFHEEVYGVHIHHVGIDLQEDFINEIDGMCNKFVWCMRSDESFMGHNFDIIHCHDWLAAKALVQMKQAGRNCVLTMHSTEYGRCGNVFFDGNSARVRDIEREGCDYADRVLAVSGRLCDELKSQFNVEHKLRMAYNGIHANQYEGFIDCAAVKGQYGIGPMQPVVLFVGRLAMQKGPDILLEAVPGILQSRNDAVVVFVGDGHMREQLEGRAHELGVAHAVRWLGSVNGEPLKNLFKACDTVVVPSRNEPFGIVVLEAWASGKPPVVSTSGGPGEFVRHEEDGYHIYADPGSVVWGVSKVFENFEKGRAMGLAGRQRCDHEFSWDNIAHLTEEVYLEIC